MLARQARACANARMIISEETCIHNWLLEPKRSRNMHTSLSPSYNLGCYMVI